MMLQLFVAESEISKFGAWCREHGVEIAPMARYFHEHPNKMRYDIYGTKDQLLLAKLTWGC